MPGQIQYLLPHGHRQQIGNNNYLLHCIKNNFPGYKNVQ